MVRARSRIFVFEGFNEWASDLHFESSRAETEAFSFLWAEIGVDFIGVGRWGYWGFGGEIVLVAVAEVSGSAGPLVIGLVESLAYGTVLGVEALGFGEGVKHFGFGGVGGAVAYFYTVGGDD